ncbi:uncharacterized protein LOC110914010 [Helianthus annuus]|uniref:uncharacterized protein LOC110914010 n=1 Tax=Helianthus annuus TaxID=4232 RepID=UPI000B8FF717|nr:uncharacterized protein LOC110914010 [Helianthus annuus]
MNPCRNLDESRNRALRYIRLKDDKKMQERMNSSSTYESTSRKSESSYKPYRSRPYGKNDSKKVNAVEDEDIEEYPELSEYCLGDKARWPRKNQQNADWKDKSKWCAFHEDFGYVTEDCIALRKEISFLLSKGYLKDLLGRKKNKGQDTEKDPKQAASPFLDAKIINFISEGSDICGTSYSTAKRHAKEAKAERGDKPTRMTTLTTDKLITFDSDDRDSIQNPHHDGLVITLYIANHFLRRIMVGNGSSVNIIQLETLKRMKIPQMEITSKSTVLVWFSGEAKNTVG